MLFGHIFFIDENCLRAITLNFFCSMLEQKKTLDRLSREIWAQRDSIKLDYPNSLTWSNFGSALYANDKANFRGAQLVS